MSQDTGSQKPEAQQEAPAGKPQQGSQTPPKSLKPQGKAKASKSQKPASQGKEAQQEASKPQIQTLDNEAELLAILNQAMGSPEAQQEAPEAQQGSQEAQQEASQGKAEAKAKAEAQKMAKAQQGTKARLNQITTIFQNLTHLADSGASIAKARLTPEAQQTCKVASLASLKEQGKKALESAQEASQDAGQAQNSQTAREAQKKAQEAYKVISGAYKEAQKIDHAIARAKARADKEAQQAAQKKAREDEKKAKLESLLAEAESILAEQKALLSGADEYAGNKIVDVPLNQKHADMLNLIANGLWAEYDSQGNLQIIPAAIDLPSKPQKALMQQVIDMGYAAQQESGYILTEAGLTLFETSLDEVKSNFANWLAQGKKAS